MSFKNLALDPHMQTSRPGQLGLGYKAGSAAFTGIERIGGYFQSATHAAGITSMKEGFGFGKGIARYIGPVFMAHAAYTGYQEGGVGGAVKNIGKEAALWYAFGAAAKVFSFGKLARAAAAGVGVLGIGIGGTLAATGIGPQQLLRPYTYDHLRKHAKLEMGTPIADPFGNMATMRQRSLMAMQNSRINGMGALGNESYLLYR